MPGRAFLGDRYSKGPTGTGFDADAVLPNGTIPLAALPQTIRDSNRITPMASVPPVTMDDAVGTLIVVGTVVWELKDDSSGNTATISAGVHEASAGPPAYGFAGFKADAPNAIGTSDDYDLHDGPAQLTFVFGDDDGEASNGGHRAVALLSKAILGSSPPATIYAQYHNATDGSYADFTLSRVSGSDTTDDYFYGSSSTGVIIERPAVNSVIAVAFFTDAAFTTALRILSNRRWNPEYFVSAEEKSRIGRSAALSDDEPLPVGTASAGTGTEASRDDHVHAGADLSDNLPLSGATADAGDGTEASRDDHIHPPPTIASGTGNIDEAPGSRTYTNEVATANWQAPTAPFNYESNVAYMFIARVGGLTYGDLVTSDALTRLAEGTPGQSSAGAGQAYSISMGTNELRIGRQSGNRFLFAVQTAVTIESLRIVKLLANSGLLEAPPPRAVHTTPSADVVLNAPLAAYTFAATDTELWRYTATAEDHRDFDLNLLFEVGWPATAGDRAGLRGSVSTYTSDGTLIETLVQDHELYLRNINTNLGHFVSANIGIMCDLSAGDYVMVKGRALRQTENTGTLTLQSSRSDIQHRAAGGGVSVGGAGARGQQQAGESPATGSFTRRFIRRSATAPTFSATFNGTTFDGLDGWVVYTGGAGYPSGTDPLWITDVVVFQQSGVATGWGLRASPPQALSTTLWAHDDPDRNPATAVTTTEVTAGNAISRWASVWTGTAYGPWRELNPEQSIAYHSLVSGNYRALTRGTTLRLPFTRMDLHSITDLRGNVSFYTIGGLVSIGNLPFELSPQQEVFQPADRADTITVADGAYTAIFDQSRNETLASFYLKEEATYNFGAGQYGVLGLQWQFQRPTGVTTGTEADSVLVGNPTTFDSLRRVRMGIDLWWR